MCIDMPHWSEAKTLSGLVGTDLPLIVIPHWSEADTIGDLVASQLPIAEAFAASGIVIDIVDVVMAELECDHPDNAWLFYDDIVVVPELALDRHAAA
jgi:hypothetical protein